MSTQYTSILKFALPQTGELSGTWGDVVNDNITSMVEQAIAGLATINTWTGNSHTLTTANGTTSESRCAMLVAADGAGGTALTGAGDIICPAASKLYVLKNGSSYTITLKTAAGTGVAVPAGDIAFLFCDGTNVNACVTTIVNGHISGNLTVDGNTTLGNATTDTITATAQFNTDLLPSTDNARDLGSTAKSWRTLYCDTSVLTPLVTATNLQVTNIKANDGTAAMSIADSTGAVTVSTLLNVDNLRLDGNTISSTDSNGNITLAPNGTGDVYVDADTVRIGDSNANATLTTNGTGDLILNTNAGTNSGSITIADGADGNITIATNGAGVTEMTTAVTMSATTQNIDLGTSQTSGTFTVGGAAQTGTQTIDQSTKTHTLNIGAGATESGATKTVNLATAGVSGSTTTMSVGSAVSGAITNLTVNATTTLAPVARSTGAVSYFTVTTPADTGLTASTEVIGSSFTAATRTWATGALTLQRERVFAAPTYAFAGASTLTTAVNVDIGLPVAGTNATITNAYALRADNTLFTGNVVLNNASAALDLTNLEVTNIKAKDGTASMTLADSTGVVTFSKATVIEATDNTNAALRITQLGTGNALLVEDSTNPDATPFVVTAAGDVGIGTSSPAGKLTVKTGTNENLSVVTGGSGDMRLSALNDAGSATVQLSIQGSPLYFRGVGGAINATLDTSGNLGLGVTPSGWYTSYGTKALQFAASGSLHGLDVSNSDRRVALANNDFINTSGVDTYINTGHATKLQQVAGQFQFFTAPSGFGYGTAATSLTATQNGNSYTIVTAGTTDFTLIGAANNNVGTTFTKSGGTGAGTGTVSQSISFTQAMTLLANGNLGIGETSPQRRIHGYIATGPVARMQTNGSNAAIEYVPGATDGTGSIYNWVVGAQYNIGNAFEITPSTAAGGLTFSTPALVVTSGGNVGIGTNSPSTLFHAAGANPILLIQETDQAANAQRWGIQSETSLFKVRAFNDAMSSAVDLLIGDRSGNLGLAVTPSAWGSTWKAFQISNRSLAQTGAGAGDLTMVFNGYFDSTDSRWEFQGAGDYAARYSITGAGVHSWHISTAAGANANDPITFTQAMTLDASGNLAVGATSTSYRMEVVAPSGDNVTALFRSGDATAANNAGGGFRSISSATAGDRRAQLWLDADGANFSGGDYFWIDKKGNSGEVNLIQQSNAAMLFSTNGTEAARITSGGAFLIGGIATQIGSEKFGVDSGSGPGGKFKGGNDAYVTLDIWNPATTGDNIFMAFRTETAETNRGTVTYNRTAGLVAYNTTSDYRAKDILGPVANSGATIDALKVYEGKMKGATQSRPMLVAHEAQEYAPYAVTGEKDAVNEDGTPKYQQMDVSSLVPLLLAEIQSLRARVAQLETKGV